MHILTEHRDGLHWQKGYSSLKMLDETYTQPARWQRRAKKFNMLSKIP